MNIQNFPGMNKTKQKGRNNPKASHLVFYVMPPQLQ